MLIKGITIQLFVYVCTIATPPVPPAMLPPTNIKQQEPIAVTKPVESSVSAYNGPRSGGNLTTAESIRIAKSYARKRLNNATQFSCLDKLWDRESSWYYKAQNPSSGAYGIPQALPGSKMASAGADWRTNPITQVKWGLGYISGRYGSACNAWSFFKRNNWY